MEGKEIKSTWEIVQERVKNLGRLTPEEERKIKEKEYTSKGKAMAERFLERIVDSRDLEIELQKLKDEERKIIKKAALEAFKDKIKIEDLEKSQRALEGISILEPDRIADFKDKFFLLQEELKKKIENIAREKYKEWGISGSALGGINLKAIKPEIISEFNLELDRLKKQIL